MQQIIQSKISGYTGSTGCLILASGEALVGTDLSRATLEVDQSAQHVTLTLPTPTTLSAHLDQQRTCVVLVHRSGLWQVLPGPAGEDRVIEAAMRDAERRLAQVAGEARHIEVAQRQAERVLNELAQRHGWTLRAVWTPP